MNRLLQSGFTCTKRDDYTATGICNQQRTVSKNLYDHFVPSQRSCKAIWLDSALRAQPGAGPEVSADQTASAQPDCPLACLYKELVCPVRALALYPPGLSLVSKAILASEVQVAGSMLSPKKHG